MLCGLTLSILRRRSIFLYSGTFLPANAEINMGPSSLTWGPIEMMITNVQRFSTNDGPGIRTTVFLKGCPLRCSWCHNIETQNSHQEFYFFKNKCMRCGHCAEVCPEDVITLPGPNGEFPERDRNKCTLCMKCVDECPHGALELVGKEWTIDEIMQEVEGDKLFYENSGGGMTVSGGEPLFFPEFTAALLKRAKASGFHTCLDTSGYAPWIDFEKVMLHADMVLFDLKCMDPKTHRKVTGVSNSIILQNLHKIKEIFGSTKRLRLRLPIIPGVNDNSDFFKSVAELAGGLEDTLDGIDVLPFHNWADGKYEQLDRTYAFAGTHSLLNDDVSNFTKFLKNFGFEVVVGG